MTDNQDPALNLLTSFWIITGRIKKRYSTQWFYRLDNLRKLPSAFATSLPIFGELFKESLSTLNVPVFGELFKEESLTSINSFHNDGWHRNYIRKYLTLLSPAITLPLYDAFLIESRFLHYDDRSYAKLMAQFDLVKQWLEVMAEVMIEKDNKKEWLLSVNHRLFIQQRMEWLNNHGVGCLEVISHWRYVAIAKPIQDWDKELHDLTSLITRFICTTDIKILHQIQERSGLAAVCSLYAALDVDPTLIHYKEFQAWLDGYKDVGYLRSITAKLMVLPDQERTYYNEDDASRIAAKALQDIPDWRDWVDHLSENSNATAASSES